MSQGVTISIRADTAQAELGFKRLTAAAKEISTKLKLVQEDMKFKNDNSILNLTNGLDLARQKVKNYSDQISALRKTMDENKAAHENGQMNSERFAMAQERLQKQIEVLALRQRVANSEVKDWSEKLNDAKASGSAFSKELDKVEKEFGEVGAASEKSKGKLREFWDSVKAGVYSKLIATGIEKTIGGIKNFIGGIINGIQTMVSNAINFAKDYAKEAVEMAAGYEDALGYTEQVFGKNSAAIRQWVEENTLALRLNKAELLDSVNQFGGLFSAVGVGKEKAQEFSTSLVQLAADMSAATGVPIAQVIENLRSVMTGGAEAGYKYGLVIKEGAVKLKALQMGLVQTEADMTEVNGATLKLEQAQKNLATALSNHGEESLEYRQALQKVTEAEEALETAMEGKEIALTEAQKAEARHALIMEQSGNYKSQLGLLKTVFDNLKLSIGEKLLPVFTELVTKFNEFIGSDEGKEFLDGIVESIGNLADKVLAFVQSGDFERFITDVKEKLPGWAKDIETVVTGLADLVGGIAEFWREMEYGANNESRHEYLKIQDEIKVFAANMGLHLGDAKGHIENYAVQNRVHLADIYKDWDYYEPLIAQYISDTQTKAGEMSDGLGTSMTDADTALTTGAAAIGSKMSEIETSVSDAKDSVTDSAAGIASGIQAGVDAAGKVDISQVETVADRIAGAWERIKEGLGRAFPTGIFAAGISARAAGGPVTAGVPYIVGERGQELFIPRIDGRILNAAQTQQVLNQSSSTDNSRNFGDIHIHVHGGTGSADTADEIAWALKRKLRYSGV